MSFLQSGENAEITKSLMTESNHLDQQSKEMAALIGKFAPQISLLDTRLRSEINSVLGPIVTSLNQLAVCAIDMYKLEGEEYDYSETQNKALTASIESAQRTVQLLDGILAITKKTTEEIGDLEVYFTARGSETERLARRSSELRGTMETMVAEKRRNIEDAKTKKAYAELQKAAVEMRIRELENDMTFAAANAISKIPFMDDLVGLFDQDAVDSLNRVKARLEKWKSDILTQRAEIFTIESLLPLAESQLASFIDFSGRFATLVSQFSGFGDQLRLQLKTVEASRQCALDTYRALGALDNQAIGAEYSISARRIADSILRMKEIVQGDAVLSNLWTKNHGEIEGLLKDIKPKVVMDIGDAF